MVLMPRFLRGFAFAVDYYEIEVESLIAVLSAQSIINECYNSPSGLNNIYCSTVSRNPDGTFADPGGSLERRELREAGNYRRRFDASYQTTVDNGHRFAIRAS